jgi:hypothetical protein
MPHVRLRGEENYAMPWYGRVVPTASIVIHELTRDDGTLHPKRHVIRLVREQDTLVLDDEDDGDGHAHQALPLPDGALDAVMSRFGKPLEGALPPIEEALDLGDGRQLVRFRFLRRFDVIARDYLALVTPDADPVCELATSVTAALHHLARAASRGQPT